MELEAITTVLRPRRHWEAMDLGFALARCWWRPLYRAWFLLLLPLTLLLHLLCYQRLWLVPLLLWWLKPLLDRVPLYILSHTLFGEVPGIRQTLKALPGLLSRQALWALTFARLDPARSFHLPVWQLEQLRGGARRRRQRVLDAQQKGAAWLTFTCAHFELIADLGLVALVWLLLPDFVRLDFWELLEDKTVLQQLWINLVEIFGLSLIEPFYVAAGFTLYLNRRTRLEAWDIEIGFRRLARRLAYSSATPVLLVAFSMPGIVRQRRHRRLPEKLAHRPYQPRPRRNQPTSPVRTGPPGRPAWNRRTAPSNARSLRCCKPTSSPIANRHPPGASSGTDGPRRNNGHRRWNLPWERGWRAPSKCWPGPYCWGSSPP